MKRDLSALDDPENPAVPKELRAFLSVKPDEPPIYMGFGSMPMGGQTEKYFDMFCSILKRLGRRGVFCEGWNSPIKKEAIPKNVLVTKGVPHDWLFSRCSLAIHHGGAGTTAARYNQSIVRFSILSVKAGIPTIICPLLVDQPFWGRQVMALGVGNDTVIPVTEITEEQLVLLTSQNRVSQPQERQVRHCLTRLVQRRAKEFSEKFRDEDGIGVACKWFESYCSKNRNPGDLKCTWLNDGRAKNCMNDCGLEFSLLERRHHCRCCGNIYCDKCLRKRILVGHSVDPVLCCVKCNDILDSRKANEI